MTAMGCSDTNHTGSDVSFIQYLADLVSYWLGWDEPPEYGFLEFPREIRDAIYTLLLTSPEGRPLHFKPPRRCDAIAQCIAYLNNDFPSFHPAILACCRQTSEEARPVLYGQNHFCFYVGTIQSYGGGLPSPFNTAFALSKRYFCYI